MKTPDEIKTGLDECTRLGGCAACPYFFYHTMARCTPKLAADALTYIRELEAQLAEYEKPLVPMTLEEVFAVSRDEGNIVWLEYRDEAAVRRGYNGYYEPQHIMAYTAFGGYKGEVTFYPPGAETEKTPDPAVYSIGWRCWPRRPTDEERKAAEWDE